MARMTNERGSGDYYVKRNRAPLHQYKIGDKVDAFTWPQNRVRSMINLGLLVFVPSKPPEPPKAPAPKPVVQATDPGPDASEETKAVVPSLAPSSASRSGADLPAKPEAKSHGKAKTAPK